MGQDVEAALLITYMTSEDCSVHKELLKYQLQESETSVKKALDAPYNLTHTFDDDWPP